MPKCLRTKMTSLLAIALCAQFGLGCGAKQLVGKSFRTQGCSKSVADACEVETFIFQDDKSLTVQSTLHQSQSTATYTVEDNKITVLLNGASAGRVFQVDDDTTTLTRITSGGSNGDVLLKID